jgi:hypothetical protein
MDSVVRWDLWRQSGNRLSCPDAGASRASSGADDMEQVPPIQKQQ